MANKYGIFGAAHNGDGTASNEAASDGAAGAWKLDQPAGNILLGTAPTYGSAPAAGDVIYIRSKTGNGGNANITLTLGASSYLGSSSATIGSWITWILDSGSIWSGVDGTLTIECPSSYNLTGRTYNHFFSQSKSSWVIKETNASASNKNTLQIGGARFEGFLIDLTLGANYGTQIHAVNSAGTILKNCHIKNTLRYTKLIGGFDNYSHVRLENNTYELLSASETDPVFGASQYGAVVEVIGGEIIGAGATTGVPVATADASVSVFRAVGLKYPNTMKLLNSGSIGAVNPAGNMVATLADGSAGADGVFQWGTLSSRSDNNPPTLNATLPDSSNSKWSWMVYPASAKKTLPAHVQLAKLYTQDAATKTVTLEFLLATGFTAATKMNCFLTVIYVDDSTGSPKYLTTFDPAAAALPSSSAGWSATTWGAISFNKHYLSVTTPTSIKKDTAILASLTFEVASANANQILFVCPDVQLS